MRLVDGDVERTDHCLRRFNSRGNKDIMDCVEQRHEGCSTLSPLKPPEASFLAIRGPISPAIMQQLSHPAEPRTQETEILGVIESIDVGFSVHVLLTEVRM